MAQNALQVSDFTLPQNGGEISVTLTLDEANKYVSYGFTIQTPDGVGYVVDGSDDVTCVLGTGHASSHGATAHWNAETKSITVGVASMSSALFNGTTIKLEIPMAETTATVGTEFTFTVTDILVVDKDGGKTYPSDVTFKATVGKPVTTLKETSTTKPAAASGVDVRVKRTLSANEWNTICLPFAMTADQCQAAFGDDVQLADFTSCEPVEEDDAIVAINVGFTPVTAIAAHHPYIIKVSSEITEFAVDGVNITTKATNPTVKVDDCKMVGIYKANTTVPEENLFLNGGKFWYSYGETKTKAFRAYFDFGDYVLSSYYDEPASAPAFNIIIGGNTTAIKTIKAEQSDDYYYNINGQRTENPVKGLYIKNGKKVIIK